MNARLIRACAISLFAVCVRADEKLTEGSLPVYAPDGNRIAFQRETSAGMRLGVWDRTTQSVTWIDGAPGHAAQAAWHPSDGSLVYVYGNETKTAKEGFFAKEQTGWNLRIWKDGKIRSLTSGRFMDYTPSFSPDGKSVYFASTRVPVGSGFTSGTVLYRVPTAGGAPERLSDYGGNSSGVSLPSVSSDGRRLLWAELDNAFGAWHLIASPVDEPRRTCRLGAADLVAYSPRWSPDGRLVCCTGFRTGDSGWSVYLIDPRTGSDRRLFAGREPAFSPDGRRLAYSLDGVIREHVLTDGDRPPVVPLPEPTALTDGTPLVVLEKPAAGDRVDLPPTCAFGNDKTFYVRFTGLAPASDLAVGAQCAFAGRYAESGLGFQIVFHSGGTCSFALRTATGDYFAAQAPGPVKWGTPVDIVGIRHGGCAYVSVNGSVPRRTELGSTLDLRTPRFVEVMPPYRGVRPACRPDRIEIGEGWPADVARPCTPQELFR